MPSPPILFDNPFSPYAFKVRAFLYEKGIAHENHELNTSADREALLAINPRGEVPAIQHGDAVLYDSSVICDYLESTFPEPPLIPSTAFGQGRCRLYERLIDGPLDGVVITLAVAKMFCPKLESSHPEVVERAFAKLEGKEYLCGEYSRADIALVPQVAGAAVLGRPPDGRLATWFEKVSGRPAIERATSEFMEGFRKSQEDADPFFSREHLHIRDHRLEWCFRLGLDGWLAEEMQAGRLVFSPAP